jgi:hypothetical protein
MPWSDATTRTIILPSDAAPGDPQIILDGDTNEIRIIGADGSQIVATAGTGVDIPHIDFLPAPGVLTLPGSISGGRDNPVTQYYTRVLSPTDDVLGVPPNQASLELIKFAGAGVSRAELAADELILNGNVVESIDSLGQASTDDAFTARITGDGASRIAVTAGGQVEWSSGGSPADTHLERSNAGELITERIKYRVGLGTPETWHNLAFQNGWGNGGGSGVPGQVRLLASPANSIQLVGELAPGTKADGTVITTLGPGYRPATNVAFPVAANPSTLGSTTPLLQLMTNGQLQCFGLVAGTVRVYFSVIIPLDA